MPSHLEHDSNAELKCAIKFILQPYFFPFITLKCVCSNPKCKHSHCFFCFIIAIAMSHFTQIMFLSPFYFIGIHKLSQRKLYPGLLKSSNTIIIFFNICFWISLQSHSDCQNTNGAPVHNSQLNCSRSKPRQNQKTLPKIYSPEKQQTTVLQKGLRASPLV